MRNLMLSNALGNMQSYQEHLKTTVYIKIGGQTERIIGDSKIENTSYFTSTVIAQKKKSKHQRSSALEISLTLKSESCSNLIVLKYFV